MILINYKGLSMLELLMTQLRAGTPPGGLDYDTMQILLAPDGYGGLQFGYSVAISDDGRIITIGVPGGRTNTVATGAAYVYEKIGGNYTWIQKLTPSDGAANDQFGYSVAVSGDGSIIVIGSRLDDDKGADSGSAYVFKYSGNSYVQSQKLLASDGMASFYFGAAVSVSADNSVIVVGSFYDIRGIDPGSAYIFKYNGSSYIQVQKLTASDGASGDRFGYSVSVSGNGSVVVIGSYLDDDKGGDSGSSYVFKYDGSNYIQSQKLLALDGVAADYFGYSVSVSSDGAVIVIGAYNDDDKGVNSGSVYVFKYNGSTYDQVQKLIASDGAAGDVFGYSVSISSDGSIIVIGAYLDDDKGTNSGSVYVFKYDGQLYQEIKKLTGNKNVDNGGFGWSVDIASDTQQIAVGALRWVDASNVSTGAGFVFS